MCCTVMKYRKQFFEGKEDGMVYGTSYSAGFVAMSPRMCVRPFIRKVYTLFFISILVTIG